MKLPDETKRHENVLVQYTWDKLPWLQLREKKFQNSRHQGSRYLNHIASSLDKVLKWIDDVPFASASYDAFLICCNIHTTVPCLWTPSGNGEHQWIHPQNIVMQHQTWLLAFNATTTKRLKDTEVTCIDSKSWRQWRQVVRVKIGKKLQGTQ